MANILLGELLIQKNLVTKEQLAEALADQKESGDFLGEILVKKLFILEKDLLRMLSEQFGMPFIQLKNQYIDWDTAMLFSSSLIVESKCLPIRRDESGVTMAITNPLDATAISQAENEAKNQKVHLVLVLMSEMQEAIGTYKKRIAEKIR